MPRRSLEIDDLYGHCRRAIDLSLTQIGTHGLPLYGTGDWNDGIDIAGLEGRGESVWLACFLIDVLTTFVPLAERRHDAIAADYRQAAERLRQALDVAWRDGRYIIGFDDAGIAFEQASIMTAAWPVLSGAVGFERGRAALEAGLARLERPDRILLIDPPFDETSVPYPGRIADYPPGVRENGAQYTHGATWVVDAFLRLAEMALEAGDPELARADAPARLLPYGRNFRRSANAKAMNSPSTGWCRTSSPPTSMTGRVMRGAAAGAGIPGQPRACSPRPIAFSGSNSSEAGSSCRTISLHRKANCRCGA